MNKVWHARSGTVARGRARGRGRNLPRPARPGPGPARARPARPPPLRRAIPGQRARLPCPARRLAGKNAGPRPVKGTGPGRQDLPQGPPRRRHPGPPARRRRTRRPPAGPPRGRRQAQRDQPLHSAAGTFGPGWCRGTFDALHTVRANLAWLGTDKKAPYIAIVKRNQPLLHAQIRALPWRQVPADISVRETRHGRAETPHPEGRSRQPPGLPRLPPGHQDHPLAAGRRVPGDVAVAARGCARLRSGSLGG
jgi:hypothetical protein